MKKEIKAQAALEFLTTYGWAFLVILIMISALAYFGILNPSTILPDRCTFGAEIGCQDHMLTGGATGTIKLKLKNNVGETIMVSGNMVASTEKTTSLCTATLGTSWQSGTTEDITFSSCDFAGEGMEAGDKGKVTITITYYAVKSGSTYLHDVQGEVYATMQ